MNIVNAILYGMISIFQPMGIFIYPLVNIQKAMEAMAHRNSEFSHEKTRVIFRFVR